MGERHAGEGHAQAGAMREIAGAQPTRFMHLGEKHFLGRTVQSPPLFDATLQRPQLPVVEAAGKLPLQFAKQGLGLQTGGHPQLFFQTGPNVGENVRPGTPVMFHDHLAGQLAEPPVLTCRLGVHAGLRRHQAPGPSLLVQAAQPTHLLIGRYHPKPPCQEGLRISLSIAAAREI